MKKPMCVRFTCMGSFLRIAELKFCGQGYSELRKKEVVVKRFTHPLRTGMVNMTRTKARLLGSGYARRCCLDGIRDTQVLLDNSQLGRGLVLKNMWIRDDPVSSIQELASF
jgi:hypothetical protein